MTELPIKNTVLLSEVEGRVFVLRVDGTLESGRAGIALHAGDRLLGDDEGIFKLVESSMPLNQQDLVANQNIGPVEAGSEPDPGLLDALRQKILEGGDPTELFEPAAVVTNYMAENYNPNGPSSSQGPFTVIDRNNGATLANAGFDTEHNNKIDTISFQQVTGYDASPDSPTQDDIPPSFAIPAIPLTEDAFTKGAAVVGESRFVVKHGTDPLLADSLLFSNQSQTLAILNGAGIGSDGHVLQFEFADDRTLLGYYLDGNGQRVEVLRAELVAEQQGLDLDGRVVVTLTGPLDHQGSDTLSLGLQVSVNESDGDATSANITITVNDGADPALLGSDQGVSLQEGIHQSAEGQLPVTVGSDRLVSLNFEPNQPALAGLTSQGKATTYEVHGNQLIVKDWQGEAILTVTIGLDGKYSVSLTGAFDEPIATKRLDLTLHVAGRDLDGDPSNLGTLNIQIGEGDKPTLSLTGVTLSEGRFDGATSATDDQQGSGKITIQADSDPVTDVRLTLSGQVVDAGGKPITHNGETLSWQAVGTDGHTFQAVTSGGLVVMTVTIPTVPASIAAHTSAEIGYQVTVHTNLDQGADNQLDLTLPVQITDSDGNSWVKNTLVNVMDASHPVITIVEAVTVNEAALDGGVDQHAGTQPADTGESATGQVMITVGSDRIASFEIDVDEFMKLNQLYSTSVDGAYSEPVALVALAEPGHYMGFATTTPLGLDGSPDGPSYARPIFYVTLDPVGHYTFTLVAAFNHLFYNGGDGDGEWLMVKLPLYVTDHDGDRSAIKVVEVTVLDDMPLGANVVHTLSEGDATISGSLMSLVGADGGFGGQEMIATQMTINNVNYYGFGVEIAVPSPDGDQEMGTLVVNQDGSYRFTPSSFLDHNDNTISQVVKVQLLDRDGDVVDTTITLNVQDKPIQFVVNPAQGHERSGPTSLDGSPTIAMTLDIGDHDRGEFVDQLLIEVPVDKHGTFYCNWSPLTTVQLDGKSWYQVPASAMVTTDGVHYTLSNLLFMPDYGWNSEDNGAQTLKFNVLAQIGVTEGIAPAPITGELSIDIQAVNSAPLNLLPVNYIVDEDQLSAITDITVQDVDAGLNPISVTLRVAHGALIVTAVAGAVTVQGSATGELILQGPLDEINALLASQVYYQPDRDFWGQDTLNVITSDLGNSGLGGVLTATDTVPIYVTGQPDLPLLELEYHTVMTLPGTLVPLLLDASVVNGMPGELSVRIAGLNGAIVVDAAGNQLGSDLGADGWLLPMDQDIPLFISGLADGDQRLTLQAESSNGTDLLTSTSEELAIHVGGGKDVSGTQGNELLLGDDNGNVLTGEAGNDLLIGGGGSDLFLWSQGNDGGINAPAQDVISDFNIAEGDVIHVAALLSGVSDTSINELLKFVDFKVSDAEGGLKNINMALSPLGDGNITQQISMNNVDLSMFAGSSESEILKSLVDNKNICVLLDVNAM